MSDGEDTEEQRRLAEKKQRKADKRKRAAAEAEKDTTPTQPSSDSDAPHKRKSERRRKEEDSEAVKEEEEQASEAETKAEEASPSDGADSKPRGVGRKEADGEEYIDVSPHKHTRRRSPNYDLLIFEQRTDSGVLCLPCSPPASCRTSAVWRCDSSAAPC